MPAAKTRSSCCVRASRRLAMFIRRSNSSFEKGDFLKSEDLPPMTNSMGIYLGGRYPALGAFFIASTPSSKVINWVVLLVLRAPPAATAMEKAAALT